LISVLLDAISDHQDLRLSRCHDEVIILPATAV
jgi:hypothetical protein